MLLSNALIQFSCRYNPENQEFLFIALDKNIFYFMLDNRAVCFHFQLYSFEQY